MPTKHLPFGGSTIDRIINCPAAYQLSQTVPPPLSSSAADRGTMLHDAMEQHIAENTPLEDLLSLPIPIQCGEHTLAKGDIETLQAAKDAVTELFTQYNITDKSTILVEPFVQMVPEEVGGSIDLFAISEDGKTMVIADYKFGYNPVSPKSPQLLFYALCADYDPETSIYTQDVETIVTAIIQPANEQKGSPVLLYSEYPIDVLDEFEDTITKAIAQAKQKDPAPSTGKHCQFCPAQTICPAKTGQALHALQMDTTQAECLHAAMELAVQLEPWIKAVKQKTHEQLELGIRITGWKLVQKRAVKKWKDLTELRKFLRGKRGIHLKELYTDTPLSPTQMIKTFKEKEVDYSALTDYIDNSSSGTTLAPESDKRPEAVASTALKLLAGQ